MKDEQVRQMVREGYGEIAKQGSAGCGCSPKASSSCCGTGSIQQASKSVGYTDKEINEVPEGANLGLGCGNPIALASLKEGEVVLDLGSGGGFDCFLAASRVGPQGKVIGVDMTAEMLDRARENARKGKYKNVEFRLGEIENLPVADKSVDVIISNCVINLSPDKKRVFAEAFRVLKPGGRLMVSDLVLLKDLPDFVKESAAAYIGCVAGASRKEDYLAAIDSAGFQGVKIVNETVFPVEALVDNPTAKSVVENLEVSEEQIRDMLDAVASIKVTGFKR